MMIRGKNLIILFFLLIYAACLNFCNLVFSANKPPGIEYEWDEGNLIYNYSFERPANREKTELPRGYSFQKSKKESQHPDDEKPPGWRIEQPFESYHENSCVQFDKSGEIISRFIKTEQMASSKLYMLSIYAKKSGDANASLKLKIYEYTGKRKFIRSISSEAFELTDSWQKYSLVCEVKPAVTELWPRFIVKVEKGTKAYLDYVSFSIAEGTAPPTGLPEQKEETGETKQPGQAEKETKAEKTGAAKKEAGEDREILQKGNLLYNYSFEKPIDNKIKDMPKGWVYWKGKEAFYSGKADGIDLLEFAEKAYHGSSSIHFEKSGAVVDYFNTDKINPTDTYRISCYARAQKGGVGKAFLRIFLFINESRTVDGKPVTKFRRTVKSEEFKLNSYWSEFRFDYTPKPSEYPVVRVGVKYEVIVEGDTDVYLDKVSFSKVSARTKAVKKPPGKLSSEMDIAVPHIKRKPKIDGVVGTREWGKASLVETFTRAIDINDFLMPRQNRVYLEHDGKDLYIGLQTQIFKGEELKSDKMTVRDGPWGDDCFQVFIVLPGDEKSLVFSINSKTFHDDRCDKYSSDASYQTKGEVASSQKDGWFNAEMRIPAKELGVDSFSSSTPLRFNVIRYEAKLNSYSALKPVRMIKGSRAQWHDFALLSFREDDLAGRLRLENFTKGNISIKPEIGGKGKPGQFYFYIYDEVDSSYHQDPVTVNLVPGKGRKFEKRLEYRPNNRNTAFFKIISGDGENLLSLSRKFSVFPDLLLDYSVDCVKKELYFVIDAKGLTGKNREGILEIAEEGNPKVLYEAKFTIEPNQKLSLTVPLDKLMDGDHVFDVRILDSEGMTDIEKIKKIRLFKKPYWLGNKYGLEDIVPPPWTPVKYKTGEVSVWGRKCYFENGIFPVQMESAGEKLLAGPIRLYIKTENSKRRVVFSKRDKVSVKTSDTRVVMEQEIKEKDYEFRGKTTVEYDGMVLFEFAVLSKEHPITELYFDTPIRNEVADAFFHSNSQRQDRRMRFLDRQKYAPMTKAGIGKSTDMCLDWENNKFWCNLRFGNMDRGITWFGGREDNWFIRGKTKRGPNGYDWVQEGGSYYDVIRDNTKTIVRVYLVTKPAPKKTLNYVFGVQAYPTSPKRKDCRRFIFQQRDFAKTVEETYQRNPYNTNLCYLGGPSYLSPRKDLIPYKMFPNCPMPIAPEENEDYKKVLRNFYEYWSPPGRWPLPYMDSNFASMHLDAYKYFEKLWNNDMHKLIYPTANFTNTNRGDANFQDYWIWQFYHYVKRYGVAGAHFDCCMVAAALNEANGLVTYKEGRKYPVYPVLSARRMKERIYKIMHKFNKDPYLEHHSGEAPWWAFCTHRVVGEEWRHFHKYYFEKENKHYEVNHTHDLRTFRYMFAANYGPEIVFLPELRYDKGCDIPTVHLFGLIMLHDLSFRSQWIYPPRLRAFLKLREEFGLPTDFSIVFHPYWKPMPEISNSNKDLKISYYQKKGAVMVILCNVENKPLKDTIILDMKTFNFKDPEYILYDPVPDKRKVLKPKMRGGKAVFDIEIDATVYKVIFIKEKG